MEKIFFDSWDSIFRSVIITILAYGGMILILRVSGKRTLSKMNAYDFVITVALGSAMASVALNKDITLADGLLVFGLFSLLQYVVTKLSIKHEKIRQLVTNRPTLLLYKGQPLEGPLRKERITMDELYVAARRKGFSSLSDIDAIVLESSGELTILDDSADANAQTLSDVEMPKGLRS